MGNMVTRVIIINIAVFIFINLAYVLLTHLNAGTTHPIYHKVVEYLSISSNWWEVLTRPWTIFTHMFTHEGFWHLLWNMLFIYWFGRIVGDFIGDQHILPIIITGGLAGAAAYFLSANIMPYATGVTHHALGASAAAMALVVGGATISPDYNMRLLFLGDVKLKYIAAALVLIDLVGTAGQINTGGHFGHLGGAALGYFYILQLRKGAPFGEWVNDASDIIIGFLDRKPKRNKNLKVVHNSNKPQHVKKDVLIEDKEQELNRILDKIKEKGLGTLSENERNFLNEMSDSK